MIWVNNINILGGGGGGWFKVDMNNSKYILNICIDKVICMLKKNYIDEG